VQKNRRYDDLFDRLFTFLHPSRRFRFSTERAEIQGSFLVA
jgi:hypothetical protein